MRIGIFTDSYRPYTSGVVRSIETFAEELTGRGHDIYIFAPNYKNVAPERNVFRFPSLPAPTNNNFSLAVPFRYKLKQILQSLELDLIHAHSPFILGHLGARYAQKMGLPLVFTYHTLYEQYTHYVPVAQKLTRQITHRVCSDFANQCDLVVTPTHIVAKYLRQNGVTVPVKKIPTGIKLADFNRLNTRWLREEYGLQQEKVLLYVGRLGVEKNIGFLLNCFKKIYRQDSNVKLIMVGGGPAEKHCRSFVQDNNLEQQIIFTGELTRDKVLACYAGADLFVFSSLTETQGLVLAEAKGAGLPVVAVEAYGVSEMVIDQQDGFLTAFNEEMFISKVLYLLHNDHLRKIMSEQAVINARKLSAGRCAEELINCYRNLLENKSLLPVN